MKMFQSLRTVDPPSDEPVTPERLRAHLERVDRIVGAAIAALRMCSTVLELHRAGTPITADEARARLIGLRDTLRNLEDLRETLQKELS